MAHSSLLLRPSDALRKSLDVLVVSQIADGDGDPSADGGDRVVRRDVLLATLPARSGQVSLRRPASKEEPNLDEDDVGASVGERKSHGLPAVRQSAVYGEQRCQSSYMPRVAPVIRAVLPCRP